MGRWIGWLVVAMCGVARSQSTDLESSQKILGALRNVNKAQVLYQVYGRGFACRLEQLGPPQNGAKSSAQAAGLISEELASGRFAGYQLNLACTPGDYQVTAVPVSEAAGAIWCVDKSMVLRTSTSVDGCINQGKVPLRPKRAGPDQFSTTAPEIGQETQARGYWVDSSTDVMWASQDSDKRMGQHKAVKYCRKLKVNGYSNWRLPSIAELTSLVNLQAYATEYVGSSDIMHWNGDLRVNGGLLLNGDRHWSSTQISPNKYSAFDYRAGKTIAGFEDWAEGDTMYALCVRTVPRNQANKTH
jgi:hypothetical protein